MEWVRDAWVEIAAFAAAASAAGVIARKGWQFVRAAVKLADMHQTLTDALPMIEELNEQFQPNGGLTVADSITALTRGQEELREAICEVKNAVDCHIASTRPGGRRATDPQ